MMVLGPLFHHGSMQPVITHNDQSQGNMLGAAWSGVYYPTITSTTTGLGRLYEEGSTVRNWLVVQLGD